eukprot:5913818-Prymnesium_polylepis.1
MLAPQRGKGALSAAAPAGTGWSLRATTRAIVARRLLWPRGGSAARQHPSAGAGSSTPRGEALSSFPASAISVHGGHRISAGAGPRSIASSAGLGRGAPRSIASSRSLPRLASRSAAMSSRSPSGPSPWLRWRVARPGGRTPSAHTLQADA